MYLNIRINIKESFMSSFLKGNYLLKNLTRSNSKTFSSRLHKEDKQLSEQFTREAVVAAAT